MNNLLTVQLHTLNLHAEVCNDNQLFLLICYLQFIISFHQDCNIPVCIIYVSGFGKSIHCSYGIIMHWVDVSVFQQLEWLVYVSWIHTCTCTLHSWTCQWWEVKLTIVQQMLVCEKILHFFLVQKCYYCAHTQTCLACNEEWPLLILILFLQPQA